MNRYRDLSFKKFWICYKIKLFSKLYKRLYFSVFFERSKKDDFVIFKIDYLRNMDLSDVNRYFFICIVFFNITFFNFLRHEKYINLKIAGIKIKQQRL